ncbi:Pectinesterase [Colletotrichum higginsianum IMI 349063]|uniref:Pectinesterase n=4 Tax=Colletotrichum higginsianum TaxID=80884 RepID=A0A1B7XY99_COLHI|nr:Pectinesterase [Colletotrichum higginsianum IMI 349063]OBR04748.1 Pectinesterase [Colletotrichum higginsianum IMI 349063]TIC94042.1 Pectinesterase [Colletotrichum higginsianum]GJC99390.1 pectinesterase [Colletotrichum higginsianum]
MKLFGLLSSLTVLAGSVWAASRTSPPSGSIVVAKSGGKFTSLQAAINSISTSSTATTTIFIQPGTYSGQVSIPSLKGKLVIYAYTTNDQDYTKNQVTLTNSLSAAAAGSNDLSATLRVATNYFSLYNVNLVNGYGKGSQALAVSANGQYQAYYGCSFVGYQDTVYTNKPHQVYKNSYIEGAVDFIFGNDGNAWFEKCTIAINGAGYITASGRDTADAYWYVINKSKIAAKSGAGVAKESTVLGRPWREYARTVVQNTDLSNVVKPVGWSAWGTNPTGNVYYAEYGNTGTGASGTRVSWAKKLSSAVSIDSILPGWTSWVDTAYWNSS